MTAEPAATRRMLTARDAAGRLAVHASTVRRWCAKRAMASYRVGPHHRLRIEEAEVLRHLRPAE